MFRFLDKVSEFVVECGRRFEIKLFIGGLFYEDVGKRCAEKFS